MLIGGRAWFEKVLQPCSRAHWQRPGSKWRFLMKFTHTLGAVISAAAVLLAVCGGVAYFLYRISREKAYNEKWKDYVDCGLA